jgi:hypothetical protein
MIMPAGGQILSEAGTGFEQHLTATEIPITVLLAGDQENSFNQGLHTGTFIALLEETSYETKDNF